MKLESFTPTKRLEPFVKTLRILEADERVENRLLPDTTLVMAFRLRGTLTSMEAGTPRRLPRAVISGLRKSPRRVGYEQDSATLLVQFREGGAGAFFREPLVNLFGQIVALDNLIPAAHADLIADRLVNATTNPQRIALVEEFLLSELREGHSDPLILDAVQRIEQAHGDVRIHELAASLNISRDAFEKRFARTIGTLPKQFSSVVRLKNVIAHYGAAKNLTDAALAAGYYDQAHFIKDFKGFSGQTPTDFFHAPSLW